MAQAHEGNKECMFNDSIILRAESIAPTILPWSLKGNRHDFESQLCDYWLCDLG